MADRYHYIARVAGQSALQGRVNANGIRWTCQADRCQTTGPWPVPAVTACRALATMVGEITEYGHSKARLSPDELRQCNLNKPGKLSHRQRAISREDYHSLAPAEPGSSIDRASVSPRQPSDSGIAGPTLDHEKYEQLTDELQKRLPAQTPEWNAQPGNGAGDAAKPDQDPGRIRFGDGLSGRRPAPPLPDTSPGAKEQDNLGQSSIKPDTDTLRALQSSTNALPESAATIGSFVPQPDSEQPREPAPATQVTEQADGSLSVRPVLALTVTGLGARAFAEPDFEPLTVRLSQPLTLTGLGSRDLTPAVFEPRTIHVSTPLTVTGAGN